MAWTRLLTVIAMFAVLALPFVPAWAATDGAGVVQAAESLSATDPLPPDVGEDPAPESTEAEALLPMLVLRLRHCWAGPPGRRLARDGTAALAGPTSPPPRGPHPA